MLYFKRNGFIIARAFNVCVCVCVHVFVSVCLQCTCVNKLCLF